MSLEHKHLALKGAYRELNLLLMEISPALLLPRAVGAPVIHINCESVLEAALKALEGVVSSHSMVFSLLRQLNVPVFHRMIFMASRD